LKVKYNHLLSNSAFNFNLSRYTKELSGACDEATDIVLQHEFTGGGGGGGSGFGGRYEVGGSLLDDDVVGAAIERAYL
jgi:hypothetical protein